MFVLLIAALGKGGEIFYNALWSSRRELSRRMSFILCVQAIIGVMRTQKDKCILAACLVVLACK